MFYSIWQFILLGALVVLIVLFIVLRALNWKRPHPRGFDVIDKQERK